MWGGYLRTSDNSFVKSKSRKREREGRKVKHAFGILHHLHKAQRVDSQTKTPSSDILKVHSILHLRERVRMLECVLVKRKEALGKKKRDQYSKSSIFYGGQRLLCG